MPCFTCKYKKEKKLPPKVFFEKKGVLKNFSKFTGKNLCRSLFLIMLQAWRYSCSHVTSTIITIIIPPFCKKHGKISTILHLFSPPPSPPSPFRTTDRFANPPFYFHPPPPHILCKYETILMIANSSSKIISNRLLTIVNKTRCGN